MAGIAAGLYMINLIRLEGSVGKTECSFRLEMVWQDSRSVQCGVDGDHSVTGCEMFHD